MIIEAKEKKWEIKDCTYAERRELHKLNAKVWWKGEMNVESYYEVLEKVGNIAGLGENDFKDMQMQEVDEVLQAIFLEYLGISPTKKDSGG
tara:strand:- start:1194 stop:1466 length:273 start_codon:yes stop_codon:yes gene_type:complete